MRNSTLQVLVIGLALGISGCEKPEEQAPPPIQSTVIPQSELDSAQIARGRLVYEKNCQECHGVEGKGQVGDWRQRKPDGLYPPPPLDDTAHAWHHPTVILRKSIKQGSPPDMGDMPPWEGKLSDAEIDDVIVYVKSLWSAEVYGHWLKVEQNFLGQ